MDILRPAVPIIQQSTVRAAWNNHSPHHLLDPAPEDMIQIYLPTGRDTYLATMVLRRRGFDVCCGIAVGLSPMSVVLAVDVDALPDGAPSGLNGRCMVEVVKPALGWPPGALSW